MSRIGKQPILIPANVTVSVQGQKVTVKSGSIELTTVVPPEVKVEVKDNQVLCTVKSASKNIMAKHGLARSLVANLISGVVKPFVKTLEIQGTGYRAVVKGEGIELFLGYSHPVIFNPPAGVKLELKDKFIIVSGADKYLVGQATANIRDFRKPDVYKGKGIRYQGEVIKLKPGKAAKAAE